MNILIAGAGERGKRLAYSLLYYDLKAEAFIDNDRGKWDAEIIQGLLCYPIDYFVEKEDNYLILVSPLYAEELYFSLKKYYKNVLSLKVTETILQAAYNAGYEKFFPIGHFYSLYPKVSDILEKNDYAETNSSYEIAAIDLCEELQHFYLEKMINLYKSIPKWKRIEEIDSKWRYRLGNPSLSYGDAVGLFCMLNILKHKKMIEIGSGWS